MTEAATGAEARIRLFYSFELDDRTRSVVAAAQERLKSTLHGTGESSQRHPAARNIRWTQAVDMHITALFLGDFSTEHMSVFTAAGATVAAGLPPFTMTVHGLGRFPRRGPARVVWAGANEPADKPASTMASSLRELLPQFELDPKPFVGHITLGYLRPDRPIDAALLDKGLAEAWTDEPISLTISRLVLMQTLPKTDRIPITKTPPEMQPKTPIARYNAVQVFPFADTIV
jgi:2'-5' RNA ligase